MDTGTDHSSLRDAAVAEAEKWLGTPFHVNASVRGGGVACGPLLIAVYDAIGISVPHIEDFSAFPIDWHQHAREEKYLDIVMKFSSVVESPRRGDIAMFKMGRAYAHSAVVIAWPFVIHSYWGRNVEITDATKPPIARHLKFPPIFLSPFQNGII